MRPRALLSIRGLTVEFKVPRGVLTAVSDLDLDVYEGEVLGIVGESGCGKSVLAHTILKLCDPNGRISNGSVLFEGKDVLTMSKREIREYRWRDASIVFQGAFNCLNPVMKVFDHMVDTTLAHEKASRDEVRKRSIELLKMARLDPEVVLGRYSYELSGGMKQRTVSAMAMLLKPKLLILDEPTSALDVLTQKIFLKILSELRKGQGLTMIFITHDLASVAEIADRVAVMYGGTIIEASSVENIFYKPRHPYTKALLKAIPSIVGDVDDLKPLPGPLPDPIAPPPGCEFHPRCPYSVDICSEERPAIKEVADMWFLACHRVGETV